MMGAFDDLVKKKPVADDPQPRSWEQVGRDVAGGVPRGAGSIGATLMAPFDYAEQGLSNMMGMKTGNLNEQRREKIDQALTSAIGSDPSSPWYKGSKLLTEVVGTLGVPAALAIGTSRAGLSLPVIESLRTGGMSAGGMTGMGGIINRLLGGSITGGAAAGLVDPRSAGIGAAIGGAVPVIAKGAAEMGGAVGRMFAGQVPPVTQETATAAQKAIQAGVTLPPSMVDPSVKNRVLESISGKQATQQISSAKNQALAADAVRKDLGIAQNVPLNFAATKNLRDTMVQTGYEPLRQFGQIPVSPSFTAKLDAIAKPFATPSIPSAARPDILKLVQENKAIQAFDSGDAIDAIRNLRAMADTAYSGGDKALGGAYKGVANAYESAIDDALSASGQKQLLTAFREARQKIAQSFTADKALREGGGTVDAKVFGNMIQRGKPISGAMREIGEAANVFPSAFKTPQQVGSPDVHNLKSIFSMGGGGAGATIGGLLGGPPGAAVGAALAAPIPFVAPALARKAILSQSAQQSMANRVMQSITPAQLARLSPAERAALMAPVVGSGLLASP